MTTLISYVNSICLQADIWLNNSKNQQFSTYEIPKYGYTPVK